MYISSADQHEVTIYGNDTTNDPCSTSPAAQALGQPIACYNAAYHYYSIDMCDQAAALTSASPEVVPGSQTRAIVGGVVDGVLGLALMFGVMFCMVRNERLEQQIAAVQQSSLLQYNELYGYQQSELDTGKVVYGREAYEVEALPVEVGAQEVREAGKTVRQGGLSDVQRQSS